ncbi:MAG: hypothetical protein IPL79_02405 [Myxococcales bacterium]|nr:hypothetical protein [Myxococcales bacterium]
MNLDNFVARVERRNYALGGPMVLLSLLAGSQRFSLGVAVGVAVTCANFAFLARIRTTTAQELSAKRLAWLMPKLVLLILFTLGALLLIPMSPLGFGLGYLLFAFSIFIELARTAPPALPAPIHTSPNQP